jgi:transposase
MSHHRVGCDAHKRYSQFAVLDQDGQLRQQTRFDHEPGAIQGFLESLPEGTPSRWTIDRFDTAGQFTSYAGLVPTVHASGGKTRLGHMRKPSNQYLKWAFIEAANVVVRHRHHPAWKTKYVCQVYDQVCQRRGHAVAVGAVTRHLAEAAFWILKRQEPYRPPVNRQASPKQVRGRA